MSHELPYLRWLAGLKVGDAVAVYFDTRRMDVDSVTSAPTSRVSIGRFGKRVSFNRHDGKLCGKRPLAHRFRIEQP